MSVLIIVESFSIVQNYIWGTLRQYSLTMTMIIIVIIIMIVMIIVIVIMIKKKKKKKKKLYFLICMSNVWIYVVSCIRLSCQLLSVRLFICPSCMEKNLLHWTLCAHFSTDFSYQPYL